MEKPNYIVFNPMNSGLNYQPVHYVPKIKINMLNEVVYSSELEPIKSYFNYVNVNDINEYNSVIKFILNVTVDCFKK
jgi:hypothetical protein